jgi:hypothetical protein
VHGFGGQFMESLRREIRAIGPDDGPANRVQLDAREEGGVSQWFENLSIKQRVVR